MACWVRLPRRPATPPACTPRTGTTRTTAPAVSPCRAAAAAAKASATTTPSAAFGIGTATHYGYTAQGQLAHVSHTIDGRVYTLGYGYDSAGALTSISSPSGAFIQYQRDAQGRVTHISGSQNGSSQTLASNIAYAPFGPLTTLTYGNGLTLTRSLDSQYRLTGITTGPAFGRQYTFNGNDDISAIRHSDGRQTSFQYDALRRLIQADLGADLLGYSYDANGNRLSRTSQQGSTHYTLASDSNRLLGRSGLTNDSASYDANGNLIARGSLTFAYDRYNRLTAVYDQGTLLARYRYNALHQRIAKTVNGVTTHYLYDQAGQLLAEFDAGSGLPRVEYVWLDDLPIAMLRTATDSPGVYFIHSDHLNTPQWVSNPWGNAVWAADYRPFGQATITNATLSFNLRFPGQYFDAETGLHYNWHRYYDPSSGRYVTSDPIGLASGLNTYAYVGGNPLRYADPTGLEALVGGPAAPFPLHPSYVPHTPESDQRVEVTIQGINALADMLSVAIGPWDGSSDISNPEVAGEKAADEMKDEEVCPPEGGSDYCATIRRQCRQRCIDKWFENAQGGIPQGKAADWTRSCRAACTWKFGCGPDVL